MAQEQFDSHAERAEKELFVISTRDDGWRMHSAHNRSRCYLVSEHSEGLDCTYPTSRTMLRTTLLDLQAHFGPYGIYQGKRTS